MKREMLFVAFFLFLGLIRPFGAAAGPLDNWWHRNPPLPPGDFVDVAFGNGYFVALGSHGTILVSADGQLWTAKTSFPDFWGNPSFVSFANGLFYFGYGWGKAARTADCQAWTYLSWVGNQQLTGLTYGNGIFVATTELDFAGNNLSTSASGAANTWTQRNAGLTPHLYGVAFGGNTSQGLATGAYAYGNFVTVGLGGTILSSTNGINWITRTSESSALLIGDTAGENSFLAVGDYGTILQSNPFPSIERLTLLNMGTTASIRFQAMARETYTVQARAQVDNVSWRRVADVSAVTTNRTVEIFDPIPPGNSQGLYRLVSPIVP